MNATAATVYPPSFKGMPLAQRLANRTSIVSSGCWEWLGPKNRAGYGVISVRGHHTGVHRAAYELARGPIPAGMTIDHLCNNTCCVNPDHLAVATYRENNNRGTSPTAKNSRKTHCLHGHELKPRPDGTGRYCQACNTVRARGYRAKRRAFA